MKVTRFFLLLLSLTPVSVFANTIYFPEVVYGGGYTTNFTIINTGTALVSSQLIIYSQQGTQLGSIPILVMGAGSTRYSLSDKGPLKIGWGVIAAGTTVQGVASFDQRNDSGVLVTSSGMLGLDAGNSILVPVESSFTGVAIANANTSAVNVRLRLLGENGSELASRDDPRLNPLGSRMQIVDSIGALFPEFSGTAFRGALVVETSGNAPSNSLAVTGFTLKEGLFSAVPVVPVAANFAIPGTPPGAPPGPPPGPSPGPSPDPPPGGGTATVAFEVLNTGGATIQFQGQTITTNGLYTFKNLGPGTYDINGTVGQTLNITFLSGAGEAGPGGVVPGSLQNIQGPPGFIGPVISGCSVKYMNTNLSPQLFQLRFTVTTSTAQACQRS
ncbi:MAG TPA: hypothetical protein VKK06_00985 [Terriglobia bacterium]|nr:hypothetical protein [Terriglobia bacterium]